MLPDVPVYLITSSLILTYPGFVAATATFSNDVNIPTLSTVIAAVELFAYAIVSFCGVISPSTSEIVTLCLFDDAYHDFYD